MAEETEKKLIYFESATLFQELINKGQLKNLRSVKSNPYPTYCFIGSGKVVEIVSRFIATHNMKSDRSADDNAMWEILDKNVIGRTDKPEAIVTRNLNAVKRIVQDGYGYMLKRTCVDQYKKKCFIFYADDRIAEIKAEEDRKNKEKYEKKNVELNGKKQSVNTQMSKLIKKVMEGIR